MDASRVDQIIKYALAVAGRSDDRWARELGLIHLLKYVYLADLAYAESHAGQTFTGAAWQFYNYGPWSLEVYDRIGPVLADVGAIERVLTSSRAAEDFKRWRLPDEEAEPLFDTIDSALPHAVTAALKRSVREYGDDTTGLLHYVYTTSPMLRAAPGEMLVFEAKPRVAIERTAGPAASAPLSEKARRRREDAIKAARERVRLASSGPKLVAPDPPVPYDEVYADGMKWLESLGGDDLDEGEAEAELDDDIWKSRGRRGGPIPG